MELSPLTWSQVTISRVWSQQGWHFEKSFGKGNIWAGIMWVLLCILSRVLKHDYSSNILSIYWDTVGPQKLKCSVTGYWTTKVSIGVSIWYGICLLNPHVLSNLLGNASYLPALRGLFNGWLKQISKSVEAGGLGFNRFWQRQAQGVRISCSFFMEWIHNFQSCKVKSMHVYCMHAYYRYTYNT